MYKRQVYILIDHLPKNPYIWPKLVRYFSLICWLDCYKVRTITNVETWNGKQVGNKTGNIVLGITRSNLNTFRPCSRVVSVVINHSKIRRRSRRRSATKARSLKLLLIYRSGKPFLRRYCNSRVFRVKTPFQWHNVRKQKHLKDSDTSEIAFL